jgi:hypothetical protein
MKKLIKISAIVFTVIFSSPTAAQSPLPEGTYTIGSGGDFTTITSVFSKLSTDGISGPVTLELIDTLYTSAGFYINGPITGAGTDSRITIRPADNKNVTVRGSNNGFQFSNISYLTLDGIALTGATTLTVHSSTSNGGTLNFALNSDHNIVQNITVINDVLNFSHPASVEFSDGIAFWRPSSSSSSVAPDSNLIQNNFIKKASVGIYLSPQGFWNGAKGICTGNIIRDNIIGSETDSLISWGIECERTKNTIVEGNVIQNIRGNITGSFNSYPPFTQNIHGINLVASTDCIIRNNIVNNIKAGDYPPAGILLTSQIDLTSDNNLVYNNMVYDIQSTSNKSGHSGGIEIWNQDNPKIYYNTIYLSGSGSQIDHDGSADLWIQANCKNVEVKNNIFVNTKDESSSTASCIYYLSSDIVSNNNDLFYTQNQNNCLVRNSSGQYNTLPDWQAEGHDMLSISEMPNFKAPDLHIDENIPTNLESNGTPIAGIDLDFDGDARDTVSPDIGADEFDGTTIVGVKNEKSEPLIFALYQNYPNPFNPSTTIKYSIPKASFVTLRVYDILGREVATLVNEEKPAANYEIKFNANNLSSGVYFYRIAAGNFISTKKFIILK